MSGNASGIGGSRATRSAFGLGPTEAKKVALKELRGLTREDPPERFYNAAMRVARNARTKQDDGQAQASKTTKYRLGGEGFGKADESLLKEKLVLYATTHPDAQAPNGESWRAFGVMVRVRAPDGSLWHDEVEEFKPPKGYALVDGVWGPREGVRAPETKANPNGAARDVLPTGNKRGRPDGKGSSLLRTISSRLPTHQRSSRRPGPLVVLEGLTATDAPEQFYDAAVSVVENANKRDANGRLKDPASYRLRGSGFGRNVDRYLFEMKLIAYATRNPDAPSPNGESWRVFGVMVPVRAPDGSIWYDDPDYFKPGDKYELVNDIWEPVTDKHSAAGATSLGESAAYGSGQDALRTGSPAKSSSRVMKMHDIVARFDTVHPTNRAAITRTIVAARDVPSDILASLAAKVEKALETGTDADLALAAVKLLESIGNRLKSEERPDLRVASGNLSRLVLEHGTDDVR